AAGTLGAPSTPPAWLAAGRQRPARRLGSPDTPGRGGGMEGGGGWGGGGAPGGGLGRSPARLAPTRDAGGGWLGWVAPWAWAGREAHRAVSAAPAVRCRPRTVDCGRRSSVSRWASDSCWSQWSASGRHY